MTKADERAQRAFLEQCAEIEDGLRHERNRLEMLLERVPLGDLPRGTTGKLIAASACVGLAANALRKVVEKKHG